MFCEGWSLNPYLSSPTLATGLGYNWGNSTPVDPSSISDSRSGSVAIVGKSGFLHSLHGAPHLHHPGHDKMSDRETLLSMGFDPARVDCECVTFWCTLGFTLFPLPARHNLRVLIRSAVLSIVT